MTVAVDVDVDADADMNADMDVDVNSNVEVDVEVDIGTAISSYIYQYIIRVKGYTSLRCVIVFIGGGPGPLIVVGLPAGPEQRSPSGQHPMIPLLARTQ